MKYLAIHLGLGLVLIAQAVIRSKNARYELRKNTLETLTTWMGVVILWPIVLAGELREWWRDRKRA